MQDFLSSIHNFGQGVDNAGKTLYNDIRSGTMNFDKTFGIPDSRNTTPLLNPVPANYAQAPLLTTPTPQQHVLAAHMQAPLLASPTQTPNIVQQAVNAFDPNVGNQQAATQVPESIPGVDPKISKNMLDLLNNHILPVTRKYGIPDAVTAGQMAQESGFGAKPVKNNNYFGLKSHHGGFAQFDTPEAGATYYAQTITNNVPTFSQLKNNPSALLRAIQSQGTRNYEGDNNNPMQYVVDVSKNNAWKAFGQQPITIPGTD